MEVLEKVTPNMHHASGLELKRTLAVAQLAIGVLTLLVYYTEANQLPAIVILLDTPAMHPPVFAIHCCHLLMPYTTT